VAGRFLLLTDEHIPRAFVRALRERSWDVVRVVDEPRLGKGTPDEAVFAFAIEEGRVLVSSDIRSSWRPGDLLEAARPFPGMVVWSQKDRRRMSFGDAIAQLEALAREEDPFAGGIRRLAPAP